MSDHSLFQPQLVSSTLPRYDRRKCEGMAQFGPDEDDFTIFVTPTAVRDLHEGTRQRVPHEAFGMLMGRAYADERGSFTVVSDVVYARNLNSSRNHVQLSAREMHTLRNEAQYAHPAAEFVGWTHSHRDLSGYSPIDFKEQKTWTEEYHVGILTFMDSIMGARETPWAIAYRGPSSRSLPLLVDASPLLKENDASVQEQKRPAETSQKLLSRAFLPMRSILQPLFLFFLTAAIALGIFLGNFLSLRLLTPRPVVLATSLLWDCDQRDGKAPLKVTCTGPVGPDIQGWVWNFGDGTMMGKSLVTHTYAKSGRYTIKLTVLSSTSTLNAGSLLITVAASTTVTPQS